LLVLQLGALLLVLQLEADEVVVVKEVGVGDRERKAQGALVRDTHSVSLYHPLGTSMNSAIGPPSVRTGIRRTPAFSSKASATRLGLIAVHYFDSLPSSYFQILDMFRFACQSPRNCYISYTLITTIPI
jgi:hypothetical protein